MAEYEIRIVVHYSVKQQMHLSVLEKMLLKAKCVFCNQVVIFKVTLLRFVGQMQLH